MRIGFEFLLIGLGGAVGAAVRYSINEIAIRFTSGAFPVGTLVANLAGCFMIGMLLGSGLGEKSEALRLGFGVGFLGALTTFSTFGADTITRIDEGQWGIALLNVAANVLLGLTCVVLGMVAGKKLYA